MAGLIGIACIHVFGLNSIWISHGLRNLLCRVLHGICRDNCFISREFVYILRCFHSYSFASNECLCALKIKYSILSGGCQFLYTYLQRVCIRVSGFIVLSVTALFGVFQSFCNLAVSFHIHIYKDYAWVSALIVLLVVRLLYFESLRVSVIIHARHNKEGRTQFVLTHPNYGSLLHDKYFIFVWAE